jgi:hypothetical protein
MSIVGTHKERHYALSRALSEKSPFFASPESRAFSFLDVVEKREARWSKSGN